MVLIYVYPNQKITPKINLWHNRYADGHTITIYQNFIHVFMITPKQQIVCSIVSRQLIADLSPTSRQRVADQSQPIFNQLAINRPPVADRSPTGRRFLGIVVADQLPIDL